MNDNLSDRTIEDFGDQWSRYTENEGYYSSTELLADMFGPLLPLSKLQEKVVVEIGSGTGRIVNMLLSAGARHVTALEPSQAMHALRRNTAENARRITYIQGRGDELPAEPKHDLIVSIGVLHHIPDPAPVVRAAYEALKPGGEMLVWLYGREGNAAYLSFVLPVRAITTRLPHPLLAATCWVLNGILAAYIALCRVVPLPLKRYMTEVVGKFSWNKRYLVIYDQLKPAYAKYYKKAESVHLLEQAGFKDVKAYHRHGYSWTVIGTR